MSRRRRPPYRPGLGWILGVAFGDTLTRPVRLAQEFTYVRCCGLPRASSPHGLTAPGPASHDGISLRAVASGSRLLPTRPAKDFHLQSSAHARHTSLRDAPSGNHVNSRQNIHPSEAKRCSDEPGHLTKRPGARQPQTHHIRRAVGPWINACSAPEAVASGNLAFARMQTFG